MGTGIIIDNLFFIKKVSFEGEDDSIVELFSLTKEINERKENRTTIRLEVMASCIRETSQHTTPASESNVMKNSDIKKYISKEEAERLSLLVLNEEAFLERVNNII